MHLTLPVRVAFFEDFMMIRVVKDLMKLIRAVIGRHGKTHSNSGGGGGGAEALADDK